MRKLPALLVLVVVIGFIQAFVSLALIEDPAGMMAVPVAGLALIICIGAAQRMGTTPEAKRWLVRLVLVGFGLRLLVGTTLLASGTAVFFGGDFFTFHQIGNALSHSWATGTPLDAAINARYLPETTAHSHGSRTGFYYFVGALYFAFGSSLYITATVICMFGAIACLLVYAIARDLFSETVGRRAATLTCYFPSIVLWTCQGYKDGLIIFSLLLAYRCTQKLQSRLTFGDFFGLALSLWAIYQIRGYIFYVAIGPILLALTGRNSGDKKAFYNQLFGIVILGIGIVASGLGNNLLNQLQEVNLKEVSTFRSAGAQKADSSIEKDADVSTPASALAYLPTGVSYFLFAPFPWQMAKFSQAITLPEMIVWWSLFPSLWRGIRYALRERLGESSGILIFLVTLTLVYGLAQGNVGTAYRVRAQLLVFYFMFASAGLKERHLLTRFLPKAPEPAPSAPPPTALPQRA